MRVVSLEIAACNMIDLLNGNSYLMWALSCLLWFVDGIGKVAAGVELLMGKLVRTTTDEGCTYGN